MAWRETLLRQFGPGFGGGVTFGQWLQLLRDNQFTLSPSCVFRALAITSQSLQNSVLHWNDRRQFSATLDAVDVPPPLFVLGHWRNGTTHLHNLLTVDQRFAYPNTYQCMYPHAFLFAERFHSRLFDFFMPPQRPMDNVQWTMSSPQEDEFALCLTTLKSPYLGWVFPKRRAHYDAYLTFRGIPNHEIRQWQASLLAFLQKLTWKLGRPLILKSPPHTCRIKLLLEMFPQAKFVHIRRDPYTVFQSSKRMFLVNLEWHRVQQVPSDDLDEWILRQYRRMYEVFFEERKLIPAGNYHELSYEDLEQDPMGQMKRIYESLKLPDFAHVASAMQSYVDSLRDFKKNQYAELPDDLRQRISHQWRQSLEAWRYST